MQIRTYKIRGDATSSWSSGPTADLVSAFEHCARRKITEHNNEDRPVATPSLGSDALLPFAWI
jgi:hypothetical protein